MVWLDWPLRVLLSRTSAVAQYRNDSQPLDLWVPCWQGCASLMDEVEEQKLKYAGGVTVWLTRRGSQHSHHTGVTLHGGNNLFAVA